VHRVLDELADEDILEVSKKYYSLTLRSLTRKPFPRKREPSAV